MLVPSPTHRDVVVQKAEEVVTHNCPPCRKSLLYFVQYIFCGSIGVNGFPSTSKSILRSLANIWRVSVYRLKRPTTKQLTMIVASTWESGWNEDTRKSLLALLKWSSSGRIPNLTHVSLYVECRVPYPLHRSLKDLAPDMWWRRTGANNSSPFPGLAVDNLPTTCLPGLSKIVLCLDCSWGPRTIYVPWTINFPLRTHSLLDVFRVIYRRKFGYLMCVASG